LPVFPDESELNPIETLPVEEEEAVEPPVELEQELKPAEA